MGLLKALVFGMASLILAGIAVIAWGLAHHWTGLLSPAAKPAPAAAAPAAPAAPLSRGGIAIEVPPPAGMHFEQMATAGDMLVLRFAGPQGERVLVVDPRTGQVSATISIPSDGQ